LPNLIAAVARDHPAAERLEVWFLDEARGGQTGRGSRRWFERALRPRGGRDLRHEAVYLFGAVCPERDLGVALVLPTVGAAAMQAMLDELAQAVSPGAHAVVLMDRGWHVARDLIMPANLTPVFLPPYSPELNAIERAGCICASASSRTGSGPATTPSSMPAAPPGTRCSPRPAAFALSAPSTGPHRSVLNGGGYHSVFGGRATAQ
jgi:hypothetical protein